MMINFWKLKLDVMSFFTRIHDIFYLFAKYPGLMVELCMDNSLPTMYLEQVDSIYVITTKKSSQSWLGSDFIVILTDTSNEMYDLWEVK